MSSLHCLCADASHIMHSSAINEHNGVQVDRTGIYYFSAYVDNNITLTIDSAQLTWSTSSGGNATHATCESPPPPSARVCPMRGGLGGGHVSAGVISQTIVFSCHAFYTQVPRSEHLPHTHAVTQSLNVMSSLTISRVPVQAVERQECGTYPRECA